MCSICGIIGGNEEIAVETLHSMSAAMKVRGPDQSGCYLKEGAALGHNRLAVIDVENGMQPMTRFYEGEEYTIVYNGELYNTPELKAELERRGIKLQTRCDTEIVLYCYIIFGDRCPSMLNGIFAFGVYCAQQKKLFLTRDRFGIKPLFYAVRGERLIFASEIKALLQHPDIRPKLDQKGMWELMYLSPVRLGGGIFKGIEELMPAHMAQWEQGELRISRYWSLAAQKCGEGRTEIIEHTRELLTDCIRRQLVSDVPLCTLLSGGLDSSIISAVAVEYAREHGQHLHTYSFEYEGNKEAFHSSLFQPQSDDDYAVLMARCLGTEHHILTASPEDVANLLGPAALARDFPGQADIDSSLLYYCSLVKKEHTVAISGECADEIFGGYPWFYRPEMLKKDFFPWIHEPMLRPSLFRKDLTCWDEGYDYLSQKYRSGLEVCPLLDSDSASMQASRRATWLSVNYFMSSLLERKDRMSMASSVEVRVPFADHRLLEYIYNIPWEIKFEGGVEKALLRNAMAQYLPEQILRRKKSPYPKTHSTRYEEIVLELLRTRLSRSCSPLAQLLDFKRFEDVICSKNETWFGQLMSRPQLLAWLLQFDLWAEALQVNFSL